MRSAVCREATRLREGSSEAFIIEKKLDKLYTYGALSEMRLEDIGELIGECLDNGNYSAHSTIKDISNKIYFVP